MELYLCSPYLTTWRIQGQLELCPGYVSSYYINTQKCYFRYETGALCSPDNNRALSNKLIEVRCHCQSLVDIQDSESIRSVGQIIVGFYYL